MPKSTEDMLAKVRALLAKAENPAATEAEAMAYTAKATELMAKYGIEQALLADSRPTADVPGSRIFTVQNPWAGERASLLYGLAGALRCRAIHISAPKGSRRVHVYGFASDLERTDLLYTSLLLQMANGLAHANVPSYVRSPRAWRRSWLLGYRNEVVERVQAIEDRAAGEAAVDTPQAEGRNTALVLADRQQLVNRALEAEHPNIRRSLSTYTGGGDGDGRAAGARANLGQTAVGNRRAIGSAR